MYAINEMNTRITRTNRLTCGKRCHTSSLTSTTEESSHANLTVWHLLFFSIISMHQILLLVRMLHAGYTGVNWHSDCWKSTIQTPKHHRNATIDSFFVGKRGTYRPSSYMHMNNCTQFSTNTHNTIVHTQTNLSLDE